MLLIIILILGVFIYLKVQILGDVNSSFNKTYRYKLGSSQFMRSILGMHNYGDARDWYLKGNSSIVVEVVSAKNIDIDQKALDNFAEDIQKYIGRYATVFNYEEVPNGVLTDADIGKEIALHRKQTISGQPNLFIIYADDFEREGTEIAKTYNEYAMVLSNKRVKEVTSGYPGAETEYVESTLLHEFGHQLGLEHNEEFGCIMNESVEKPVALWGQSIDYIKTKFCDFELNQLKANQAAANK